MREIHHVVFHRPGPAWDPARPMFEQPGLQAHVEHYRQWLAAGRMLGGGPFVDATGGGMMIARPELPREEVEAFALADPAVTAGLLLAEVRPWVQAMKA